MDISVHCIPHTVRRGLSEFLEPGGGIGLCGWELLMEELGYPPTTITFTRNAPKSPDETITELVLRRFANEGGTVERLLEVFEHIRYLDAHTLLLESLPAIRKNHEAQSIDNHMEYSGGEFVKHPPCYDCRQLHDAMPSQWSSDTVPRPHAAQPQHPRSLNYVSCDDRSGDSMVAQASHISKMDTEETMMVTDGCDEYPIAMANVQLRDCKGIDDLMSTPLEPRSPLLSGTSPCDRNNNDSELKFLLKSPPRDIKPDKSVLLSTQTEQQDRPYTQSPFGCSTAAETRENVTTETIPKKEEQNRTSCCIEQNQQGHGFGVDVRPKPRSSFPCRPDNSQTVTVVEEKPRVYHERPLQTLSNGIRSSGKKRPSIFVTYVHDDDRHRKRVISLMQFLTSNGFSSYMDSCEGDRPGKVLKQSLCHLKQFVFVLFCISPDFKKAVAGHRNENNNNKYLNAREIHQMLEEEFRNINKNTPPFTKRRYRSIPVLFTDSKAIPRDIPDWLKNCGPVYEWPEHHRHLAFYLSRPESCFDDPLDTKSCITQSVTPC